MAVVNYRVSDLDGKSKVENATVIAFDDERVSIDLSEKERKELREFLARYFDNGVDVSRKGKTNASGNADAEHNAEVRRWAQTPGNLPEGVKVPQDRGRISADVYKAFDNAHSFNSAAV